MKKILLTTTALALSFGVSGAYAMGNAEINLSGSSKWTYDDSDNGSDATGGQNNTSFKITNSVTVDSSASSDSGLTYGTSLTLQTGGGAVNDDGMKLFVKGSFGELRTGGGGAGDTYGLNADGSVEGETNYSGTLGSSVAKAGDSSISYFTPSISGFQAAMSYTDAGRDSKADSTELAIAFSTDVGDGSAGLNFVTAATDGDGADSGGGDDMSFGATYSVKDFAFRVAVNSSETENADGSTATDKESVGFGLSYQLNDALKFGLYSIETEDNADDSEVSEVAASLTYVIAPGLSTNLAHTNWEEDDESGSTTSAYIKVAF